MTQLGLPIDPRRVLFCKSDGTWYHISNIREIDTYNDCVWMAWVGTSFDNHTDLDIFLRGFLAEIQKSNNALS